MAAKLASTDYDYRLWHVTFDEARDAPQWAATRRNHRTLYADTERGVLAAIDEQHQIELLIFTIQRDGPYDAAQTRHWVTCRARTVSLEQYAYGEPQEYQTGTQALAHARAWAQQELNNETARQAQIYMEGTYAEVLDADADDLAKTGTRTYRGWAISFSRHRPVTGLWAAESFGVGMNSSTLPSLQRMIDQRIRDYPADGHGNTSRKM
jgi:hypothetical protein